jgi:prolipoprotein diacylglyceryl transferase
VALSLGQLEIRWYGVIYALGFFIAINIIGKTFQHDGAPEEWLDTVFIYFILAVIIGSRLGHVFFYDWAYYSQHPAEIFMVWRGGLASHGGAAAMILTAWLLTKYMTKVSFFWLTDRVFVGSAFVACLIRIGNLMNSEIVGKATGTDWGFIFAALGEDFPRHPAQLYEAIAYFTIFIISILIYKKHKDMIGSGFYFGFCLATIFTFRFFVEFCKEVQVDFEEGMALDMGQILSIPFMLIGAYFIYRGIKLKIKAKN